MKQNINKTFCLSLYEEDPWAFYFFFFFLIGHSEKKQDNQMEGEKLKSKWTFRINQSMSAVKPCEIRSNARHYMHCESSSNVHVLFCVATKDLSLIHQNSR